MTCGTAIVMGTESTGLTPIWRKAADAHILIPMLGRLDSLNVSVSAAIMTDRAQKRPKTLPVLQKMTDRAQRNQRLSIYSIL